MVTYQLEHFKAEVNLVEVTANRYLEILPFVLKNPLASWYQSNANRFDSYESFRRLFLNYYHPDGVTYAKLTRLWKIPFNPKIHQGVEQFVTTRFCQIRDLDPTCSDIQICNSLIPLLPVTFQRQIVSVKNLTFFHMLESIRRHKLIYDIPTSQRKACLKS